MLVEDDDNLREIYEARLITEGYEIVSAHDGEEALALAMKEKPDLIISDIMMPKISGFDMLDILRSTPETKDTKVIMMTALSQAEDKTRADKLGADRYLVKSQVTLEDVAKIAREVLEGWSPAPAATPASSPAPSNPVLTPSPAPVAPVSTPPDNPVAAAPVKPAPQPSTPPAPAVSSPINQGQTTATPTVSQTTNAQTTDDEKTKVNAQVGAFVSSPPSNSSPASSAGVSIPVNVGNRKILQPMSEQPKTDIHTLIAEEERKSQASNPPASQDAGPEVL